MDSEYMCGPCVYLQVNNISHKRMAPDTRFYIIVSVIAIVIVIVWAFFVFITFFSKTLLFRRFVPPRTSEFYSPQDLTAGGGAGSSQTDLSTSDAAKRARMLQQGNTTIDVAIAANKKANPVVTPFSGTSS